jgi:hypothetical protein
VDPEPGKPSPYHRGLVGEHQVLICPACQPAAAADLTRCTGCGGVRLIRRLDQIECLGCGLIREAGTAEVGAQNGDAPGAPGGATETSGESGMSGGRDSALAAEVARALERMRRSS